MWPVGVVIQPPVFNLGSSIVQTDKNMFVEALIPELTVEALNIGILGRLPGLDKVQFDTVRIRPGIHSLADEFRSVVDGDDFGQSPGQHDALQNPSNALTG